MKEKLATMQQVVSAEQGIITTTILSEMIIGERVVLERTGKREELRDEVRIWAKRAFEINDREQKRIDNEDESKWFNRYDIYENFRNQMDVWGLVGSLKNMSLIQVTEVEKIKKYQYFKGKYLDDAKVLVMSADYQLTGIEKGKVHKLYVFRPSYPHRFPVFESPQFIELPQSVQLDLRGEKLTKWKISKNRFEGVSQ